MHQTKLFMQRPIMKPCHNHRLPQSVSEYTLFNLRYGRVRTENEGVCKLQALDEIKIKQKMIKVILF